MNYAYFTEGKRLRFYEETAMGATLLRVELPQGKNRERLIKKAAKFLRRAGVTDVLSETSHLESFGLRPVETGTLYRRYGAEVALAALMAHGLDASRSVVGIRGNRWTQEMSAACCCLAQRVRAISLALPGELWDAASWELQQRFGLSVLPGDGTVTLCFSPCEAREGRLLLDVPRPKVEGVRFGCAFPGLPADAEEGFAAVLFSMPY